MLRQSLKSFIKTLLPTSRTQAALQKLEENEFHKRLRNELVMLPIPKGKYFRHKVPFGVNPIDVKDEILEKQQHSLLEAINRVSLDILYFGLFTMVYILSWYFNQRWTQLVFS